MRKVNTTHLLLVLSLALVALGTLTACTECVIEEEAQALAGPRAVNCGYVELEESAVEAHACTVDAFRRGEGFYAIFDAQGIDSQVELAVVGDANGNVWFLNYDGECCGEDTATIGRRGCIEPLVKVEPVSNNDYRLPAGSLYLGCVHEGAPYDIICEY